MSYTVRKVAVWACDTLNRPGMLARVLEALTEAGAQLEFLIGRRVSDKTSRIFVAPLKGKHQKVAAEEVGVVPAAGMRAIRIEGPDRRGLGSEMARVIAAAGVNIRGVSGATIGRKAVFYFAFGNDADLNTGIGAVRKLLRSKTRRRR